MDERQRRCGLPHCQWCGRMKILCDRNEIISPLNMARMPPTAVYLCPICDEVAHVGGPLAVIIARSTARHLGARRTKELE